MRPHPTLVAALTCAALTCAALIGAPLVGASPARAAGQARICASDLTNFDDQPSITVPAGLVFAAWGPASGDLRTLRLDPNYPPARTTGQTAFVTRQATTLTAGAPCALVPARTLLSTQRAWHGGTLSPRDDIVFQAVDSLGPHGVRSLGQEELDLAALLGMNILTASPAAPIDDPVTVP